MVRFYRRAFRVAYEESFDKALLNAIRPGDCVWDVGANVGHFTVKFAELVGKAGKVVAFEPSMRSLTALAHAAAPYPQVLVSANALADFEGDAAFAMTGDSVTDSLSKAADDTSGDKVSVMRGDRIAAKFQPNVVKIDVEGFEPDVLRGMPEALKDPTLRGVFVEVHFLELAKRGLRDAPAEITRMLKDAGFRIRWTDPSHLAATR